ncbi:hypothetical protein ACFWUP_15600 [Nocardia sp. NPDC058658]|uniref:hypothetical protein n=1 Tax=Nocardia sp. NPDC058658 TaxID=3346580 RepID=UPI00364B34FA
MTGNLDPLTQRTTNLAHALTTARTTVTAANGLVRIDACADGEISIHIDNKVLVLGGDGLSKLLTELAAHALREARSNAANALAEFRSDRRVAEAVANTVDAMSRPIPPPVPTTNTRPHHATSDPGDDLARRLEYEELARENDEFLRRNRGR